MPDYAGDHRELQTIDGRDLQVGDYAPTLAGDGQWVHVQAATQEDGYVVYQNNNGNQIYRISSGARISVWRKVPKPVFPVEIPAQPSDLRWVHGSFDKLRRDAHYVNDHHLLTQLIAITERLAHEVEAMKQEVRFR